MSIVYERARAIDFDPGDEKVRIVFRRQGDHQVTLFDIRLPLRFMGRLARRDEQHARQLKIHPRFLGNDEMPVMNGIECAANNAEPRCRV